MTNTQIIKANGFNSKRIDSAEFKGAFGGTCTYVVGLFNSCGEVLNYDGTPYYPAGRNQAFASLIKSGDINAECFTFKPIQ
jgi:uncharacterized membrane protein YiaA